MRADALRLRSEGDHLKQSGADPADPQVRPVLVDAYVRELHRALEASDRG